jgi:hypothetical protein
MESLRDESSIAKGGFGRRSFEKEKEEPVLMVWIRWPMNCWKKGVGR